MWGAKYQIRNKMAAVTNTGMAMSGLVRNVILAIAKRKMATRSFNKAKSQLSKEGMIFFELNKIFLFNDERLQMFKKNGYQ